MVTWANFGQGFVLEHCAGCHSAATPERYGAPEAVVLDTVDDVWLHRDDVLATAAGDDATMPPASPASDDQRTLLTVWLTCADEGT